MKTRGIFYIILGLLLLSLLGVEGCPDKKEGTELGAYIGGTSGLDISFVDEEPPLEVLDQDDPFFITLLVENMGEYTIPKGKIIGTLSGISKDQFNIRSLHIKSTNDLLGRSKIGDEVVEGGLEDLQFDQAEFKYDLTADFKDGYETIIGERGVTLSGGQRQRLSIARALIKDPAILILDDSISAVDTKTEETILTNLEKTRKNKTTLIIAHRISTIKGADRIVIVDEGKIIDVGTHDELIVRCSFYKDMVERQRLEEEIEVTL